MSSVSRIVCVSHTGSASLTSTDEAANRGAATSRLVLVFLAALLHLMGLLGLVLQAPWRNQPWSSWVETG